MRIILFSVIFFFNNLLFAQERSAGFLISGQVVDATDSSPLQFAYLFLKKAPEFSAVTNMDGEFNLRVPQLLKNDTLIITLMGFAQQSIPVSHFGNTDQKLFLERIFINLNEITIKPEENAVKKFISDAIDKIPENYPDGRHQMEGFYRKVSYNGEEVTHLVEAALVLEDISYSKDVNQSKILIQELRETEDLEMVDSIVLGFIHETRKMLNSKGEETAPLNQVMLTYIANYIRIAYNPITHFGKKGGRFMGIPELPIYHRLMGEELVESDTVYQIAFSNSDPPDGKSYMKINSTNSAITEFQLTFQGGEHQVFVKFQYIDGHYYPEMIRLKSLKLVNRDVGPHNVDIQTIWFDEVKNGKISKIPIRYAQKRNENINSQDFEYDSEFWKSTELIKRHPLDSALVKSLERNGDLESQFKRNGKRKNGDRRDLPPRN